MSTSYRFSKMRVGLGVLMFSSIVFAPWWVPTLCALILSLRFRAWEVVLAGMFLDLYWMPSFIAWDMRSLPVATMGALIMVVVLEPLRRQLLLGTELG